MVQSPSVREVSVAPWPAAVRKEYARRRAAFASSSGSVLDLASPDAERLLRSDPVRQRAAGAEGGASRPADEEGQFDRIISEGMFTTYADLAALLERIVALLRPDGELLLIEPVGRPGWRGTVVASAASTSPLVRGRHVSRDVPAAVRGAGLLISDLERFRVSPSAWPLKHFVHARALKLDVPVPTTVDHDGAPTDRGAS
jgi:SAM-dependent methyltransferase